MAPYIVNKATYGLSRAVPLSAATLRNFEPIIAEKKTFSQSNATLYAITHTIT